MWTTWTICRIKNIFLFHELMTRKRLCNHKKDYEFFRSIKHSFFFLQKQKFRYYQWDLRWVYWLYAYLLKEGILFPLGPHKGRGSARKSVSIHSSILFSSSTVLDVGSIALPHKAVFSLFLPFWICLGVVLYFSLVYKNLSSKRVVLGVKHFGLVFYLPWQIRLFFFMFYFR